MKKAKWSRRDLKILLWFYRLLAVGAGIWGIDFVITAIREYPNDLTGAHPGAVRATTYFIGALGLFIVAGSVRILWILRRGIESSD